MDPYLEIQTRITGKKPDFFQFDVAVFIQMCFPGFVKIMDQQTDLIVVLCLRASHDCHDGFVLHTALEGPTDSVGL